MTQEIVETAVAPALATAPSTPLVLVETSRALPLVSISIGFVTGALIDPVGKEGVVRLSARLMRRTGGGRTAEQIDTLIDQLGGSLGSDVSHSTSTLQGAVIARSLDRFSDLLVDVVGRPGFGEDERARLVRETESELIEARDSDRSLCRRFFRRYLFGDHVYGRSVTGTIASLRAIDAADVQAAYRRLYTPANAVFAFSGDVDVDQANRIAARIVDCLPPGPRFADATPDPSLPLGRRLVFVDKPERTQTQILIGALGTHPHDDDHIALHVANTVFGGTFTARMTREVRSKRGWSYGAYSSLPYDRRRQAFSMWTFPKASDAAACIRLELELLETWRDKGITKSELAWAKRYLVRSHAFSIDTSAKRVGLKLDAALYALPPGYHEKYVEHVQAVTLEQANAAIRARINPSELLVCVVGTEKDIGAAVRDAVPSLAAAEVVPFDTDL